MGSSDDNASGQWRDAATLILGVWLALSPTVLAYMTDTTPALNATVVGILIAVSATAAIVSFQRWEEWIILALAAWLIVSLFLLDYPVHTIAMWNQIVVGVLVGGLALWTTMTPRDGDITA